MAEMFVQVAVFFLLILTACILFFTSVIYKRGDSTKKIHHLVSGYDSRLNKIEHKIKKINSLIAMQELGANNCKEENTEK